MEILSIEMSFVCSISDLHFNIYRKCERKSSIFRIFIFFFKHEWLFLQKHMFPFCTLWMFHSESSSKVNRADSPLPHLPSLALSIRLLSRYLEHGSFDPWESQTRANAKTYSTRVRSEQGSKIDRDLRLSC